MKITSKTWSKDSNELFDYETTNNMKITEIEISEPSRIFLKSDQICVVQSQNKNTSKNSTLFSIDVDKGNFIFKSAFQSFNIDGYNNWLVFNEENKLLNTYSDEYKLDENDIVKIGRLRLRVHTINLKEETKNSIIPKSLNTVEMNIQNIVPIHRVNNDTLSRTIEMGNTIQVNNIEQTQENYININIEDEINPNNDSIAPKVNKINDNNFVSKRVGLALFS